MTKYWTDNPCTLNQNTIFTNWNAQANRKGLLSELFFLFFIYFISQLLQSFIYKKTSHMSGEQRELNQGMIGNHMIYKGQK
jgi:hypothetical protein